MTPIVAGTTMRRSFASSVGAGKKHLATFLSNNETAPKTKIDMKACKTSMNFSLYLAASSGESSAVASIIHKPLKVTIPYRTLPLASLKLSVKHKRKQARPHTAKRLDVKVWLVTERHWPSCVNIGDRIWNVRTEPVGRSLAKCAVPLNVFLMAFCPGVFSGFCSTFSKKGCAISAPSCTNTLISMAWIHLQFPSLFLNCLISTEFCGELRDLLC